MKCKISSVQSCQEGIRLSFNTAHVGDMVMTLEEYQEIGSPTPYTVVHITISTEEDSP